MLLIQHVDKRFTEVEKVQRKVRKMAGEKASSSVTGIAQLFWQNQG